MGSIAPLKLGISECLDDNKGDIAMCNNANLETLKNKHKVPFPLSYDEEMKTLVESVTLLKNAGIRGRGADGLDKCVVDFIPRVDSKSEYIGLGYYRSTAQ